MARKVFLTGFMGCGKSSFGRRLAGSLRWKLVDTDAEIEQRAGMTIAEIFATQGEQAFRALERQVIDEIAHSEHDSIVSLGGGAVCQPGVMERLNSVGDTIYLKMTPEKLVKRLSMVGRMKRPKIAGMGDAELTAYIEKTLPERESYYNLANFVLNCGDENLSDDALTRILLQHIEKI
jgi:shikimate kinase